MLTSISHPPSTIPFHVGASACSCPVTRVKCTSCCRNREVIGIFFLSPNRAEGEPAGHVRREIQTFQRHQVHDEGWQVPGADIKTAAPWLTLDQTTTRLRGWSDGEGGDGSWYSPCVNTFQDMCTTTGSVAVKNGPLHIETSVYLCVISIQAELPVHPISSGGSC